MTALLMTAAVCVQAQSKPEPYFSFRELPNMLKWTPAPPDTTGAAFTYDIMQYMWGKEMRQNKERADTILARGMMYGESRVIVGAHWQSDVDAGRLASAALYARLHTSDRFLEQMRRARQEFLKKSK